ncbi:uncharacterized protein [Lolium perenne]|uniref:uncharacterized protein n=1 Tax=Lolium perenne TaxID=4522 RepID=UPI003A98EFE9
MENMSREFFEGLFTRDENLDPAIITNLLHEHVDEAMNEKLCAPFTEKEIGSARLKFCAYKLDMAKAYDRVDLRFLEGVLAKLGFHHKWVQWVMACVTTVRYSEEIEEGVLNDLVICKRAPGISHLLFADDCLMFFEGSAEQAMLVKDVLDGYERCTGQLARYYPSGNQNSSTTWQGIIYGLELLKKGVVWRIGNGSSVRIFRDNWLPRVDDPKVDVKRRTNRRRWVSELINPATRSWDERLIREICYAHDADVILSIKLPMTPYDDFVAWLPEKNDMFTVSSAYRLGLEPALTAMSPGQSSSNPNGDGRIWDLVWKAKVPLKLKVFAWKAATETLAVKVAVHRRISTVLPTCTTCGCGVESVHHALVTCTPTRALREGMRVHWDLPTEEVFNLSGKEWILNLLLQSRASQRDQVIFLLWRV